MFDMSLKSYLWSANVSELLDSKTESYMQSYFDRSYQHPLNLWPIKCVSTAVALPPASGLHAQAQLESLFSAHLFRA